MQINYLSYQSRYIGNHIDIKFLYSSDVKLHRESTMNNFKTKVLVSMVSAALVLTACAQVNEKLAAGGAKEVSTKNLIPALSAVVAAM